MESLRQKIRRLVQERVEITDYNPGWAEAFRKEKEHLRDVLPARLLGRIEHFGSTAVPGLSAKPIIDILVEVTDLGETRDRIVPALEAEGYDYLWRPTHGDDGPPYYAWFIKRDDVTGVRTHHIHMVESDFAEHWDRLLFKDYLIAHPATARQYETLKIRLSREAGDRVSYTQGKTELILRVTALARVYFAADGS